MDETDMSVIAGARRAAAELDAIEGRPSELEDMREAREMLDFTVRMLDSLSELVRGIAIKIDRDQDDLILDGVTDPGAGADRRVIEHARALSSGLRRRSRELAERAQARLDELLTAAERLSSRQLLMLVGVRGWPDAPEWERSVFVVKQVDFDLASSSIEAWWTDEGAARWHARRLAPTASPTRSIQVRSLEGGRLAPEPPSTFPGLGEDEPDEPASIF